MSGTKVVVDVEGTPVALTNLEKVLYPAVGFTKGQVLDYYTRIAPVLLPHLAGRALTRKRYPNGVEGQVFFEKNAPRGTPEWVHVENLPSPGSSKNRETIDYVVVDDLAALVWTANLASLELHTHMWRVDAGRPDMVVFDLDPGEPATIVECCQVALLLREAMRADGLDPLPKTSGSKGLQLYARAETFASSEETSAYAKGLAQRFEASHPDLVVHRMTKALRPGKVLVDWSQNSAAKTTISVYSLRARPRPTVSTPIKWDEVEACRRPDDLVFTTDDVLARVAADGDLFAPLL
ncbi:MAG: non-homologous end-joining DNA ligase [Actinobacteria bacterium]|nr:non-homologous end-joining DNA ligase [Actinomycetota bacterium]MCA1720179.1 non-homologous end-joining DNA ligase [Actinomycetota bacterium]